MQRFIVSTLLVLALNLLSVSFTRAHTVWVEEHEGAMVIRFAEPGKKFEKSPGFLDSLTAPVSFTLQSNAPVAVASPKKSDHFLLVGVSKTNVICTESIFTVRGGRKPHFYARWQSPADQGAKPLLTMDLVPSGKAGEVRAYLRGKRIANVKATLYTPDGKETEIKADADGLLRFPTDKPGQYLLAVAHQREPISGFHVGKPFEETSHNAALSWTQR